MGAGQAGTSITGVLTSPSGKTYYNTNSDWTCTLFFSIAMSYETGNWVVSVTNLSQGKTLSIYVQSWIGSVPI